MPTSPADSAESSVEPPSLAVQFGEAVKRARLRAGLKQDQLAGELGVGSTYISHIENGKRTPSRDLVLHLGERLELLDSLVQRMLEKAGTRRVPKSAAAYASGNPSGGASQAPDRVIARAEDVSDQLLSDYAEVLRRLTPEGRQRKLKLLRLVMQSFPEWRDD